jgi:hypothetical protein
MSFHLTVARRASYVEEVIGCSKIELERQVPVSGQFGLCRFDICGLNITLRSRSKSYFATTRTSGSFLAFIALCGGERTQSQAVGPIKVAGQA